MLNYLLVRKMKVFTSSQIREIDAYTIKHEPIHSIDLMERAAVSLMRYIASEFSSDQQFHIFAGPGNNGGDAIALARLLTSIGYNVSLYILSSQNNSGDNECNLKLILEQKIANPILSSSSADFPKISKNSIVIDGLFGTGLTRPLEGLSAELVEHINSQSAIVVSIDIPSGLFGEENPSSNLNPVIRASKTLSLQFPKLSFFFPENYGYVGEWKVVDIGLHPRAIAETSTPYYYVNKHELRQVLIKRQKFDHKGIYGHSLIIAGSFGMMGAAGLCAESSIRAGSGLVTVHIPRIGYSIIQSTVPEAIVDVDDNDFYFTGVADISKYTAICFGPGVGQESKTINGFRNLLIKAINPLVIDADGLNILASNADLLKILPKNSIITPHIGEFNRLFGKVNGGFERLKLALEMAAKYEIVIVIKGAHSHVVCPNGEVYFNSTGNPGMATGGSGDVLAGIITSLVAQGYTSVDAAKIAVYVHGLAGDLASQNFGKISIKSSDIISFVGQAFLHLNSK